MTLSPRRCAEWIDESLVDYTTRGYGASALYVQGEASMAGYWRHRYGPATCRPGDHLRVATPVLGAGTGK